VPTKAKYYRLYFSNVATDTEAKEILVQAGQFYVEVEDWITKNHPALKM
jgi:hypothetical protein